MVVALPYGSYDEVLSPYPAALKGKIVVDPSNPIDFNTGTLSLPQQVPQLPPDWQINTLALGW